MMRFYSYRLVTKYIGMSIYKDIQVYILLIYKHIYVYVHTRMVYIYVYLVNILKHLSLHVCYVHRCVCGGREKP